MITVKKYKAPTHSDEQDMTPDELVEANLPYAIQLSKQLWDKHAGIKRSVMLDDAIQAGMEGMVIASKKFDKSRGHKFITYARWWIMQNVRRTIESDTTVHVPTNRAKDYWELFRDAKEPGDAGLWQSGIEKGWDNRRIELALRGHNTPVGHHMREEHDRPIELVGVTYNEYDDLPDAIRTAMAKKLSAREAEVVHRLYWRSETLEEVGNTLGVTRERVRQVRNIALRKLKVPLGRFRDEVEEVQPKSSFMGVGVI